MTGFFLKKAFFDGWDNLISMVVINLGFLLILLAFMGGMSLFGTNGALGLLTLLASAGLFAFYSAGAAASTHAYAKYERPGWEGFKRGIREAWR
ncbi:MAG: hypothetical protein M0R06_18420, partial [Sphaerochaeta sp.]|nr:hypothetical protein [Sphaerochaeta sp.]